MPVTMELFSIYGQKVRTVFGGMIDSRTRQLQLDISDLPQGIYLLVVNSDKKTTIRIAKL
jgi:hypothetical protein